MDFIFADRIRSIRSERIRDRLEVPPDAGLISFASSMPAKELFPVKDIADAAKEAFVRWEDTALQYSMSEGILPLREKIADRTNKKLMTKYSLDNICITTGSQQGIDILGKLFINEGDVVLYEPPLQLSALMALFNYGAKFVEIAADEEGMLMDDLDAALRQEKRAKMVYICPDFMRASGKSWSLERRKEFIETVSEFDVVVAEDVIFTDFRFEGESIPSVASLDEKGQVVMVNSFSRIFCPGVRLGWLAINTDLMDSVSKVKRASDLNSSTLDQYVLDSYLDKYDIEKHIQKLVDLYRERRDIMYIAMKENFPKAAYVAKPEGGLYMWVKVEGTDTRKLLEKCMEQHVAFVPGSSFFSRGAGDCMLRLSLTATPIERIRAGIRRIAKGMSSLGLHHSTRVTINPQSYLNLDEENQRKVLLS